MELRTCMQRVGGGQEKKKKMDRVVEGEADEERRGTREVGEGKHWSNS